MVGDALGVNLSYTEGGEEETIPNEKALKFYKMMQEVNKPLFEGSSDSKLSMSVRLLAAASDWSRRRLRVLYRYHEGRNSCKGQFALEFL